MLMSALPGRARRRRGAAAAANSTDNGRAPKLLQKWGRVNQLFAFSSRARGEWAPRARRAERAADAAPSDTRAANQINRLATISVFANSVRGMELGRCRRGVVVVARAMGSARQHPPSKRHRRWGHWGVLSLRHFRLAWSGSLSGGEWAPSGATNQAERQIDPHLRRPATSPIPFSPFPFSPNG